MEFWARIFVRTIVICFCVIFTNGRSVRQNNDNTNKDFDERNKYHWRQQAQWTLRSKLASPLNTNVAKNVILFLGDGMSVTTLAATRAYLGQKYGHLGEEIKLSFEMFPYTGLSKTYCVDHNVADSACSGTAYLSGVKANSGTVGLSAAVKRGDCVGQLSGNHSVTGLMDWAQKAGKSTGTYSPKSGTVGPSAAVKRGDCVGQFSGNHSVTGLMDWAQKAGKSTGVVTTTRVTHATPAASYAHSADRRWEADTDLPRYGPRCEDIATQLVRGKVGKNIDVVLGGGRQNFLPYTKKDIEGHVGYRKDGNDLIAEWLDTKNNLGHNAKYVYTKKGLLNINPSVDSVLGLFSPSHMPYHLEAGEDDPSLAEMTQKAIQILSKNNNGFFLFVEGGRIDTAHHETKAQKALDETVELAKAVEAALRMVNIEETLVVVTSDHSHTMTYSGYSKRGSDILGFSNRINASDHQPFTTLSYATGPGHKQGHDSQRYDLTSDDLKNPNYTYPALVPMSRETHGGEDVAVFARGPWAHLFTGNYEQNYLPHALAYAACMGGGLHACHQYSYA
ncbi:alkaline phosphatase-like [Cydia splendana]|uniref:alkaline phosphatase-like n=1 Tax=Cydia splendana TaxID=1100963 RepID=UPI00300C245A